MLFCFLCKGYLTWQGHGSKTTWLKSKHALQLKTYSDNDNQDQVYFIFFIAGYSKTILVSVQHHGNLILIGRGNIYGHNTIETELTFHEEENFIVIFISTWWQKDLFPSEYLMHVYDTLLNTLERKFILILGYQKGVQVPLCHVR